MRVSDSTHDDGGKLMVDLVPAEAILAVAEVLTYGATKYPANSWRETPDAVNRYYASALRHLYAWQTGEQQDKESGLSHLAHATTNLMFMLWHSAAKRTYTWKTYPPGKGNKYVT